MSSKSKTRGSELEKAFREVLEKFLPEAGFILDCNRIQCAGNQYGCDLKLDIRRSRTEIHPIRILFECKNYDSTVRLSDIIAKPFQAEIGGAHIDLWVLVSPRRSIANDADLCFSVLQQKFPFPIVLLTPDEGVESLFALYGGAYHTIYGKAPPSIDRQQVAARWQEWFKEQVCLPRHLQLATKLFQVVNPEAIAARRHQDQEAFTRRARAFYRGKVPDWDDIASEIDVPRRDVLQSLSKFIMETTHGVSLALLLSEAGAGKSTVLRRVSLELAKRGLSVLFSPDLPRTINPVDLCTEVEAVLRRCSWQPVVICIDNAASVLEALHYLCAHLQETGQAVGLVAADRAARWRAAKEVGGIQHRFPSERRLTVTLGLLSSPEVSDLIVNLKKAQVSERIIRTDANALQEEFIRRFDGDLLVTLHEVITGQEFDQIVQEEEREFRSQYPRHRLAYAITAALHQFGLGIPESLLARLAEGTGDLQAEASFAELIGQSEEDRLLLPSHLLARITTRHEVVAQAVYRGLPEREQEVLLKGIVDGADRDNAAEIATIAILLVSSDLRRELWSLPFVGKLYMTALKRLPAQPKLFHAALLYFARRRDIDTARQIFKSTPLEYRTPAIVQDLALAEHWQGNFAGARSLYRAALNLPGQKIDSEADFTNLLSSFDQEKIDIKILTEYALFEHHLAPESTYAPSLLRIAVEARVADAHLHHVLGRMLARQNDIPNAISIYLEAEQRFAKSAPFFRLAIAQLQPCREERARVFVKALEEGIADAALYTEYALLLKSSGRLKESREIFERGLIADPTDAGVYQAYAMMEKELGNIPEARKLFERGLKADPTNAHLYQAYAIMDKDRGRIPEARELFERGLKADPTDAHLYQAYAMMEKELGKIPEARKLFERGLKADPTDAPLYQAYAMMEKKLGKIPEARELFERGLKADPTNAHLYQAYAMMEKEMGKISEARELFERGLKADPTDAHLYLSYAEMEAREKRWRRGIDLLKKGTAAVGYQNAPLFQVLGRVLAWLQRFDQAEDVFRQGLAVDPAHAPIFQEWAFVKARRGDKEGVEKILREGCARCPGDLLLHITLAQFLVSAGRRDEADPLIGRALELCGKDRFRRQQNERWILQQPFRIYNPPACRFISIDQEGIIEQLFPIHPHGKPPYGFIRTSAGDRIYFSIPKERIRYYGKNDRVIYDLIEYPDRKKNRLLATNVEAVSKD